MASWRSSSAATTPRRPAAPVRPARTCSSSLESRLDNVVYRAGLARTRRAARQLVTHGHFLVNGTRVDVPSYRVEQYDIIEVRPQSVETFPFELARQTYGDRPVPAWLKVVPGSLKILIHQLPTREQIDTILTEQLIVELYSKN